MRQLTVSSNGRQILAVCMFCKEAEVRIEDWNRRCTMCKAKQRARDEVEKMQIDVGVGKRQPAAIIEVNNADKTKVYVDKFGREVENPGYDLTHDPRGWGYSGTKPVERKTIL